MKLFSFFTVACFFGLLQTSFAADADHDGMDDAWQSLHSIAPFTGSLDPDNDGRPNLVEAINASHPNDTTNPDAGWGMVSITDINADLLDDGWAATHMRDNTALLPGDDLDSDGRKNIEESITGSNPWVADNPSSNAGSTPGVATGGLDEFEVRVAHSAPTLRYRLQVSDDLITWNYDTTSTSTFWGNGGLRTVTVPVLGLPRRFYRFVIDEPDTDLDGLSDWMEYVLGTNALEVDSDDDGVADKTEYLADSDANSATSLPDNGVSEFGLDWVYMENRAWESWGDWGSGELFAMHWFYYPDYAEEGFEYLEYSGAGPLAPNKLSNMPFPGGDVALMPWQTVYENNTSTAAAIALLAYAAPNPVYGGLSEMRKTLFALRAKGRHEGNISRRFVTHKIVQNLATQQITDREVQIVTLSIPDASPGPVSVSLPVAFNHAAAIGQFTRTMMHPVTFRNMNSDGVDDLSPMHWLMLPQGESKSALVEGAEGLEIRVVPAGSVITASATQMTSDSHLVTFGPGGAPGRSEGLAVGVGEDFTIDRILGFAVYEKQQLNVTVHPITLLGPNSEVLATPQEMPSQAFLESYLNSVFETQANIHCNVTISAGASVNWDVGIESENAFGAGNMKFDILTAGQDEDSDEELAVRSGVHASNAHVNVYYIATPEEFGMWRRDDIYGVGGGPVLGFAGKATGGNNGVIYVLDFPSATDRPHHRWAIAHEIGHYVGKLTYHSTIDLNWNPSYLAGTDNEYRLMTGKGGAKRASNPRQLIKAEWDKLQQFFD